MCKDIIMNGPEFNEFHCEYSREFLQCPEHYILGYVECQVPHYHGEPSVTIYFYIMAY